jgi:hypothetical protein
MHQMKKDDLVATTVELRRDTALWAEAAGPMVSNQCFQYRNILSVISE